MYTQQVVLTTASEVPGYTIRDDERAFARRVEKTLVDRLDRLYRENVTRMELKFTRPKGPYNSDCQFTCRLDLRFGTGRSEVTVTNITETFTYEEAGRRKLRAETVVERLCSALYSALNEAAGRHTVQLASLQRAVHTADERVFALPA